MKLRFLLWSAFLVLWIVTLSSIQLDTLLSEKENFVIGQATSDGFSIGKRISNYYYSIFLGIIFCACIYFLMKRHISRVQDFKLILWIDAFFGIGLALCLLQIIGFQLINTINFLGFGAFILLLFSRNSKLEEQLSPWKIAGSILVFVGIYQLFHSGIIGSLTAVLSFLLLVYSPNKKISFYTVSILCFLPLFFFLVIESSIVLNQRQIFGFSYWLMTVIFGLVLTFILIKKWPKYKLSQENYLFKTLVPVTLIGCVILQHYSFVQLQSEDLFETANFWNPVMQFYNYGEIPFLNNLSSHLISDYFFAFTYTALNGFNGTSDLQLYDFLVWGIYIYGLYLFCLNYFEEKYAALFFLLFFPLIWFIISPGYTVIFIALYFLIRYSKSFKNKDFVYFLLAVVLISFWNLTIGVSLIFGAFLVTVSLFMFFKNLRLQLLKTVLTFLLVSILCLFVYYLNYPTQLRQFLLYFSANQAHGYSKITTVFSVQFAIDYYVLPVVISFLFLYNFIQLKLKTHVLKNLTLILLAGVYFFSIQRGLVRHSFYENNETLITTFAWLILFLEIYHFIRLRSYSFLLLFLGSAFLISLLTIHSNFKVRSNFFETKVSFSLKDLPLLGEKSIKRTTPSAEFDRKTKKIVAFLKKNLQHDETFFDLTLNPSLHFFTQKDVPSFFNQHIQNTVTEKAQIVNLLELENSKIRFIVFSSKLENGYNNTDGIPNRVRYFRILNFIYKNYKPFKEIDGYYIYINSTISSSKNSSESNPYLIEAEDWSLGFLPYFWKPELENESFKFVKKLRITKNKIQLGQIELTPLHFLKLTLSTKNTFKTRIYSENFQVSFKTIKGKQDYYLPIGCSENLKFGNRPETLKLLHIPSRYLQSATLVKLSR